MTEAELALERAKKLALLMTERFSMNPISAKLLNEAWRLAFPDEVAVARRMRALVEALEKAQQRIAELESRTVTAEKLQESAYRAGLTAGWNLGLTNNNDGFNKCLAAHTAGIKWEAE